MKTMRLIKLNGSVLIFKSICLIDELLHQYELLSMINLKFIRIQGHESIGFQTFIPTHIRSSVPLRNMYSREVKPVRIGRGTWVAPYVKILPEITIGKGAVVGIGSVVTKDVPPQTVAVGVPARIIKKVEGDE